MTDNQNNIPKNLEIEEFSQEDIENNKIPAGLAYIIFFLPLIVCPNSPYGKFHGNQALLLFLVALIGSVVLSLIPIIGWILLPLFSLAILIFAIVGLINGFQGKVKRLPIFGNYTIIK